MYQIRSLSLLFQQYVLFKLLEFDCMRRSFCRLPSTLPLCGWMSFLFFFFFFFHSLRSFWKNSQSKKQKRHIFTRLKLKWLFRWHVAESLLCLLSCPFEIYNVHTLHIKYTRIQFLFLSFHSPVSFCLLSRDMSLETTGNRIITQMEIYVQVQSAEINLKLLAFPIFTNREPGSKHKCIHISF